MKILTKILLFLLFMEVVSVRSQTICSYKYRKRITFDPTRVAGPIDLTNFPALINITADNDLRTIANSGHVENTNGFDIVFTSADGVTLLDFQLEKYTGTNGQYTAWVKIPVLSTSVETFIYMYYGNTAISTNQSTTSVWTNYHGVWHLENSSFADNSPSGYNVTNNGTTNQSPAFINDGRANNGTQWLEVSNTFPNLTTDFTMSAWMYSNNVGTTGQRMFCDDVSNSGGFALSLGDPGSGALRFFARGTSPVSLDTPNNTIANNTWYFLTAVADITNKVKRIYVNGVQVVAGAYTGTWGVDNGNCSIAGETASGETANRLNGRIDEVRVAKSVLSADWLLTEYNNQSSPSTFYSISVEPAVWDGSSNSNWNTGANWVSGSVPSSGEDVILPNVSNQPNLNANVQIGSLWLRTGTTLTFNNNRTLSVAYDITNCGTINGSASGEVNMNATSTNAQVQYISGSGTYNLTEFFINNTYSTNPSVVLSKNVNVSGALALTSGILYTTSTNILALGTGATSTSGSTSSFVSGPMSKAGNSNFVFPIGKGNKWRRTELSNISASSTYRAEYFDAAFTSTTPVNSPLTNVSTIEYWQVDRIAGSGNANLSLYWEDAGISGITNCTDLTIARWNGASWDERPGTTTGGSNCTGTGSGIVTSNAVITAFSPFTFGSKSTGVNPLPVELIEFKATCSQKKVIFNWSTASESNNDYFTIEQSEDGLNWLEIASVKGSGTTSQMQRYSYTTNVSTNKISYVRLSQVDFNAKKESFEIISLNCISEDETLFIYPNPANSVINLEFNLHKTYTSGRISIVDAYGNSVLQQPTNLTAGNNIIRIPLSLKSGVYAVTFNANGLNLPSQKLIIQ